MAAGLLWLVFGAVSMGRAESVGAALDQIINAPSMRGGITGAIVERVSDGKVIYAHNPDLRLLPASNRKLFTSAAALELLGDGFTYDTQALASAKPDADGTLNGDIVLKGVGDSSLTTADLDSMAAQIAAAGVKKIAGDVIGDGSYFQGPPYGFAWEWDDFSGSDFPQIAGLEVNDGTIGVHLVAGGAAGDPAVATVIPAVPDPPVTNRATTAPKGSTANYYMTKPFGQNAIDIGGEVPIGADITDYIPVDSPPRYAAEAFADCLAKHGVVVTGHAMAGDAPPGASVVLASHKSVPLSQFIALMNKPSDNLLAESLIRTLGAVKGKGGTFRDGHEVEMPFFRKLGVDTSNIALVDGCGVSRRDFVTVRSIAQLLMAMHTQADWKYYYASLPIAGVDGTLRRRMKGTRAAGNVHAKTGTLSQVRALSGYFTGKDGQLYIFSLLMNNYAGNAATAGKVQDNVVEYLVNKL